MRSKLPRHAGFGLFSMLMLVASRLIASQYYPEANLPPGFVLTRLAPNDKMNPVSRMVVAPDGRLFVCEIHGALRVFKNDVLLPTPFLTVDAEDTGEHGLDGIVLDPNFETNHYVYIYYTAKTPTIHCRISRFTANGDVALPGSEVILLELDELTSIRHVGGGMAFGNDGKLYLSVGDDSAANEQNLSNLKGKILRLNPDGTIPTDNPYYSSTTGKNRAIWAIGLRNPYTVDFQRSTGRVFINDVGENAWEEIDEGKPGGNYGYPIYEGPSNDPRFLPPLFAYPHGDGDNAGCAITGGVFYEPKTPQFPSFYLGKYFFLDFCNQWIKLVDPKTNAVSTFATHLPVWNNVSLAVAPDGSLYYAETWDLGANGAVYKISYTSSLTPQIGTQPADQLVSVGETATFQISAYGGNPLSYQWRKNGTNIPGATSPSYTTPPTSLSDNNATFLCVVSDTTGASVTSDSATLTVTNNKPPNPSITLPVTGSHYRAGDVIHFAGTASDAEDPNIGQTPSAFNWSVVFHHHTHTHPFLDNISGVTSGSFIIPRNGERSTDVWYRIHLAVTDSGGITSETFVDVLPSLSQIKLATSPAGLPLMLDGTPVTTPASTDSVINFIRTIGAESFQTVNGVEYEFVAWSDAGPAVHDISTPPTPVTYTATYRAAGTPSSVTGSISASPNPIVVTDGSGAGITKVSWQSSGTPAVEVHVGSPDGSLFAQGATNGSQSTGKWVTDGTVFYLQNTAGGLPLTAANTIATAVVRVTNGSSISANPNPIVVTDGTGQGVTKLSWTSLSNAVELHVYTPNGPLMAASGQGPSSATTGKWVTDGTVFCLQDVSGGRPLNAANTLASVTVAVTTSTPSPTPTPTPTATPTATPAQSSAAQSLNLATRLRVGSSDNVLIGGISITGNEAKKMLIRGIGPSMAVNGVPVTGTLADPTIELHDAGGATIATNDNWKVDDQTHQSQQAMIEATHIPPSNNLESALVRTLAPGIYTVVLRGKSDAPGIGLIETYDLDTGTDSEMANSSARGFIENGDNVMIGGFILGARPGGTTLLLRGIGPSLSSFGLTNVLPNPALELHNANGTLLIKNDSWKVTDATSESQEAAVKATTIPPSNDLEAAIITRLGPGAYTVILKDKNGASGIGLLETYNLH